MSGQTLRQRLWQTELRCDTTINHGLVNVAVLIKLDDPPNEGLIGYSFKRGTEGLVLNAYQLQEATVPVKQSAVEIEQNSFAPCSHPGATTPSIAPGGARSVFNAGRARRAPLYGPRARMADRAQACQ